MTVAKNIVDVLDAKDELMRVAFEKGDAAAIANEYYTPDAWVLGDEGNTWIGTSSIMELYKAVTGVYTWESKREKLVQIGDDCVIEFMIGTIHPVEEGGETLVYKLQFVWKKMADDWKCASQFFAYGTNFELAAE